ncbi:hypothetical protein [uncultured Adlercreutzia sp.]|uniref:hypothetical protein n=1 Tax=uncultured Adlercreutzia sp. TaxID=875803 RepID=UPI0025CF2503|nr:hypothetical protein [uncultured Adlercreutzia sp.]
MGAAIFEVAALFVAFHSQPDAMPAIVQFGPKGHQIPDGFVLTYCDAVVSWKSLLFEGTREKLRYYSLGKVGLYLTRSSFFYDDAAVEVLQEALGPYLTTI